MLQNLQATFDKIFDGASSLDRSLRSTQFSWSEFDDSFQRLQGWIESCSSNFYESPKLVATLEEKKSLLRLYKVNVITILFMKPIFRWEKSYVFISCMHFVFQALLVDIKGHEQAVDDLQYAANSLPELDKNIDEVISNLAERHKSLKAKSEVCLSYYQYLCCYCVIFKNL